MRARCGREPRTGTGIVRALSGALFAVALAGPAASADLLVLKAKSAAQAYDWSGPYVGGHVGYSGGNAAGTLSDPDPMQWSNGFGSLYGGAQLGYNYLVSPRLLVGVEADFSTPNYFANDDEVSSRFSAAQRLVTEKIDFLGTLRGRVGLVRDHWLLYATAGLAY